MKKFAALLMAVVMLMGMMTFASAEEPMIAMITDYGDITDQSFNQTTWEAVVKFGTENNVEYKYFKPATNDTAGRVAMVERAIDEGYNVLVMPGYAFGGTIAEISGEYPEVKIIALDVAKGDLLEGAVALKGEA
ncbi:MAG: BMP family ABC transporter substrate-binding protein, partial [Clostridia bacterium]|nr:BMP family ABC transporter substrate-binding protein [Clostridia bacterium]